jgi:hypothetical protein
VLVQAAHVISSRSTSDELAPLRAVYERTRGTRGRRKIAVVALARHLLRIAFHVWRDGTVYEPERVRCIAAQPTTHKAAATSEVDSGQVACYLGHLVAGASRRLDWPTHSFARHLVPGFGLEHVWKVGDSWFAASARTPSVLRAASSTPTSTTMRSQQ